MKSFLFIATLIIAFNKFQTSPTAYLCDNGKTNKYHLSKQCRGIRKCNYKIVEISLEKAKKKGYGLCGYE